MSCSVMATFNLPKEFPKDVQEEARKISFTVTDDADRLDLRHQEMITSMEKMRRI